MAEPKSVFGWTTIDGIKFPYLLREDKKFVAVRMVEMKLLSKYPSTYPDELKNRPPLMSHYITEREIKLLNEINTEHCAGEYGSYQFSAQDLIVKLQDFEEFYGIVKKHFPDEVLRNLPQKNKIDGGWVQVNNTVVPFVFRNDFRFVPLSVIRYAAQLLVDVQVEGHIPTDDECKYFNDICKSAGLNFKFGKSTKLVMLNMVQSLSTTPVIITELPKDDPFGAAEFKGDEQEITRLPTQVAPDSVPGAPGNAPAGISAVGPGLTGLPSGMIPPNSLMPTFPPTGSPYWMNPHMGIFPGFGPGPGAGPVPNPFGMQQTPKGAVSPHAEVNNNSAVPKDFPERPNSHGSNPRSTPSSTARRSSTGTPSPTGQSTYGNRVAPPSAAAGAPPSSMGMPPPGLLHNQALMTGNRMMFPMLPNQSPSEYQKLLQMVQLQHQSLKSQVGPRGPPPLVPVDHLTPGGRMHTAPPNVTVSRNSSIPKQGSRPRGRPPIISADEPKVRPQHSSRPISTAMANEPQINARVPIKRLDFEGKSMACLVKEGSCFALMEALSRVFFPYVPMDEFRYAVEMVLSVPVLTLTDEEEHAFIRFYGLPTAKLKCKKAIKLVDFSQYLPQLKYMYRERAEAAGSGGVSFSPNKSSALQNAILPPRFGSGNIGIRTKSSTSKVVQSTISNSHAQLHLTPSALKSMMDNKNKRGADAPPPHVAPPNKKAKKRLDDMVNRLWSKNQSSSSATATTSTETSNDDTLESGSPRSSLGIGNPDVSTGWRAVGNQEQSTAKAGEQEENEGRVLEDSSSQDEESMVIDYDGSSMDMQDASVSQEHNSVPEENAKDSLTVSEEVSPSEDSMNMDASVEEDASAGVSVDETSTENGTETANTSSSPKEEGKIATDETTCADNEISKYTEDNDASKEPMETNEATMEHSAADDENHMSEATIEQPASKDRNHLHELTTNHVPAPPVDHCTAENKDQVTKPVVQHSVAKGEDHVLKPTMEQNTNEDENRVPEPTEKYSVTEDENHVLETTMEHSASEDGNHLPEPTTKDTANKAESHVFEPEMEHSVTENDNHVPELTKEHSAAEDVDHIPEPTMEHSTAEHENDVTGPIMEHSTTEDVNHVSERTMAHSAAEDENHVPEPTVEHSVTEEENHVPEPEVEHSVTEEENHVPEPTVEHFATEEKSHVPEPEVKHSVTEEENDVPEPEVKHSVTEDENPVPEPTVEHAATEEENHVTEPEVKHSVSEDAIAECENHVPEPTVEHAATEDATAEDENHVSEPTVEPSVTEEENHVPGPTVEHSATEDAIAEDENNVAEPTVEQSPSSLSKEYCVAEDENRVFRSTMELTEAEGGNHTRRETAKNLGPSIEKCVEEKSDVDFESMDTIDAIESKESAVTKKEISDKEDVNESGEIPPVEEVTVKNEEGPGHDAEPSGTSKEDVNEGTKTDTTQLKKDQTPKEETMETEIIVSTTEGTGQALEENSEEVDEAPHEMEKDMTQLEKDQTKETCVGTEIIASAGNGIGRMLEENCEEVHEIPTEISDSNSISEQNTVPADDDENVSCHVMEDDTDVVAENKAAQEIIPDSEQKDREACEEKSTSETLGISAVATGTVKEKEVTEENEAVTLETEKCKPDTLKENSDVVETPNPTMESVNTEEKEGIKMDENNMTEASDVSDAPNVVSEEEDMEVDKNFSSESPVSDDNAAVSPATGNNSSLPKENMAEKEEIMREDKNVTGELNQFSDEQTKDDNQEGPIGATSDNEENTDKAPEAENNGMGDETVNVDAHVSLPSTENMVVEGNNQIKDNSCQDDSAANTGKEIAMEEGTDDKEEEISSVQKDDSTSSVQNDAVNVQEDTKTVAVEGKVMVTEIASKIKPSEEGQDIGDSSEISSD